MKRLLVLLLALAVAAVYAPLALAAPGDLYPGPAFSDIAGHEAEAELTLCAALGIFSGSSGVGGPVSPDDSILRSQFCKVVVVATGKAAQAEALKNTPPQFPDVVAAGDRLKWAWGYINAAVAAEIIRGYDDGTFKPDRPVSYAEAIAMLIRAVRNHDKQVPAAGWPNNYVFYGATNGFTGDVAPTPNLPCPRGDMARMLYATMKVDPLDNNGAPILNGAILEEGARLHTGIFQSRTGGTFTLDTYAGLPFGDQVFMIGAASYDACIGNPVLCVADTSGKTVFIWKLSGSSIAGVFDKLGSDTAGTYLLLEGGAKYYYTGHVPVTLNDDTVTANDEGDLKHGDELVINLGADGKAVAIRAERWDLIGEMYLRLVNPGPPPIFLPDYAPHEDYLADVLPSSGGSDTKLVFPAASDYYYHQNGVAWVDLDGVSLAVGPSAVVKINGVVSDRNALAKNDVIKGKTFGAKGYFDAGSIIEISATRNLLKGTCTGLTTTSDATGTHHYATVTPSGGTPRTVELTHYVPALTTGTYYELALNEVGQAFASVGVPWESVKVLITGSSLEDSQYYVTYDERGVTKKRKVGGDCSGLIGQFWTLIVDLGTDTVIWGGPMPIGPTTYTVLAADADNVTFHGGAPDTTYFATNAEAVVYRKTGPNTYTYIGTAGLSSGMTVKTFISGTTPIVIVYEP